jgi:hypothetical protein
MSPVVEQSESPVSSNDTYVPKHRGTPADPAIKKGIKKSVLFSGIAVATTGVAVSSGVVLKGATPDSAAAALASAKIDTAGATVQQDRSFSASRSDRRADVDPAKALLLSQDSGGQVTRTESLASGDPRDIARAMLAEFGWKQDQFGCLDSLFSRESGWRTTASNPSGAYGIPQALPGSKMSSEGPDWRYNPETQIRWGLDYIQARYGSPCGAWGHSRSHGWY